MVPPLLSSGALRGPHDTHFKESTSHAGSSAGIHHVVHGPIDSDDNSLYITSLAFIQV